MISMDARYLLFPESLQTDVRMNMALWMWIMWSSPLSISLTRVSNTEAFTRAGLELA
jgi:hypothetical protein